MALRQLHHRYEYEDIRSAYDSDKSSHSDYDSELSYQRSQSSSEQSSPAQATSYSKNSSGPRPPRIHYDTSAGRDEPASRFFADRHPQESPNASVETYASTLQSEEEFAQDGQTPEYDVPVYPARPYEPRAIPATPSDFTELFPSHRRIAIQHDDSTLDGNMNLRLDTEVTLQGGRRCDMTLFHLRMHDLRDRDFSLRRYCRDSGREVCKSARKRSNPSSGRPSLQRSLSNALNTMRPKSEHRSTTASSLKRNDSGYGSAQSSIDMEHDDRPLSASGGPNTQQSVDSNSVKLEFSNYAQVAVKRAGVKASKRYEFEYWGTDYAWRRIVRKDVLGRSVAYHLTKGGNERVLAYIIPLPMTQAEAMEEQSKGGWVPPCSMWIADENIVRSQKDIADVIVASGLIALVDDSIRTRFHAKDSQHLIIPKLQMGLEYVGPKRLINEMFKREGSGSHSRQHSRHSRSSRPSSSHRA